MPVISYAADIDHYVFSNGDGGGGKFDAANAGLDLGLLLPRHDTKLGYLFGGGTSWTPSGEESVNGGTLDRGDEWEPYFAFGVRPIIKNLYLVGTAGVSFQQTKKYWMGIEDVEDNEGHFTTSGQVIYVWKHLMRGQRHDLYR